VRIFLVVLAAAALSAGTYLGLERLGRRAWPAIVARAVAWAALGVLLLNVSCPRPPAVRRPIVLLDGSLSMTAPGQDWAESRRLADSLGEVRTFGDERPGVDSLPNRGRSLLSPALAAAAASDRPVIVLTDGEIDDAAELPADLLARTRIDVLPRVSTRDVALVSIDGPARVTAGDSLRYDISVRFAGDSVRDSAVVELRSDDAKRTLLTRRVIRTTGGDARGVLRAATGGIGAGEHLLSVKVVDNSDAEPRTDERLVHLSVVATPGVVFVANPGDWDARFLFRTIREVAALPARGYVRIGESWRTMTDLRPVSEDVMRQAIRGADLVVLKGRAVDRASDLRGRGVWLWPGGGGEAAAQNGDWYLTATPASPISAALGGLPIDSFPPAVALTPAQPTSSGWVGLMAQAGRRGAPRPAFFGSESAGVRRVMTAADGLWRWSFRGGSSEQGYRALVGATITWLLGAPDTARGPAHPVRPVVTNGRPLVFEWTGAGAAHAVPIVFSGEASITDTLRFDGAGRAEVWLSPGAWRYRLEGGTQGLVAVEQYSDELLPRAASIASKAGSTVSGNARTSARDWAWLFGLVVLGLCAEWLVRRNLGLR
jgi:hypothetical protein